MAVRTNGRTGALVTESTLHQGLDSAGLGRGLAYAIDNLRSLGATLTDLDDSLPSTCIVTNEVDDTIDLLLTLPTLLPRARKFSRPPVCVVHESGYFDELTLSENRALGGTGRRSDASQVVDFFGSLAPNPDDPFDKNLICLERSLRQDPDLLVVAFDADRLSERAAADLVRAINARRGKGRCSLFVVSSVAGHFDSADRALAVREGKVLYDGPPSGLSQRRAALLLTPTSHGRSSILNDAVERLNTLSDPAMVRRGYAELVADVTGSPSVVLGVDDPTVAAVSQFSTPEAEELARAALARIERVSEDFRVMTAAAAGFTLIPLASRSWCLYPQSATSEAVLDYAAFKDLLTSAFASYWREREEIEFARYHSRLESMASLVGGLAHDFNNSLQSILGSLDLLQSQVPSDDRSVQLLDRLRVVTGDASSFARKLLTFSRRSDFEFQCIDLAEIIADTVELVRRGAGERANITTALPLASLWVNGDPTELRTVFMNLLLNSCQAAHHQEPVQILISAWTTVEDQTEGNAVGDIVVRVSDTGGGIAPELQDRIFQPFVTSKGESMGTGLGLAVVYGTVTEHGGAVRLADTGPTGTTIELTFKRIEPGAVPEPSLVEPGQLPATAGARTAIVCDDDEHVRAVIAEMMTQLGFDVLAACDGPEALALWAAHRDAISMLVVDQSMPGMNGDEVIRSVRSDDHDIPIVWLSGYRLGDTGELDGVIRLTKPTGLQELSRVVSQELGL